MSNPPQDSPSPTPVRPAGWDWRDDARCRNVPTDDFFPENGDSSKQAKRICNRCPLDVRAACLAHALDNNEHFGTWGGLTARERANLLKTGSTKPEGAAPAVNSELVERNENILADRLADVPVRTIAERYNVTVNTVYRMAGPKARTADMAAAEDDVAVAKTLEAHRATKTKT